MNHYILSTRLKVLLVVIFSLCTMAAFAQPPGFDDDEDSGVNDESLPINDAVYFAMGVAMVYGFTVLHKRKQVQ